MMLLAQISTDVLASGLASNPLAWIASVEAAAVVFLFRLYVQARQDCESKVSSLQEQLLEFVKSSGEKHEALLTQTLPVSARLAEGAVALEKLSSRS